MQESDLSYSRERFSCLPFTVSLATSVYSYLLLDVTLPKQDQGGTGLKTCFLFAGARRSCAGGHGTTPCAETDGRSSSFSSSCRPKLLPVATIAAQLPLARPPTGWRQVKDLPCLFFAHIEQPCIGLYCMLKACCAVLHSIPLKCEQTPRWLLMQHTTRPSIPAQQKKFGLLLCYPA